MTYKLNVVKTNLKKEDKPRLPLTDSDKLLALKTIDGFQGRPIKLEILDTAKQMEGVNIGFGKHACGIIIVDNGNKHR